ncbi:MAG: hypothetical protein HQ503_06115 [Rhodospirillales bacterium]|nr:hypothetical protein [Rhodospirillales bacterium]
MEIFKRNLIWIAFFAFLVLALVMILNTGPAVFNEPGAPENKAGTDKAATGIAEVNRSNRYRTIGHMLLKKGELDRSEEFHRKSLALEEKMKSRVGTAIQRENLALVFNARGEAARACAELRTALELLGKSAEPTRYSFKGEGVADRVRMRIVQRHQAIGC